MAVPKKKKSKSRTRTKRSHNGLVKKNIMFDKETGQPFLGHNITPEGFYKGVRVIEEKVKEASETQSAAE
jgi:large subunit ribosomal protein L32